MTDKLIEEAEKYAEGFRHVENAHFGNNNACELIRALVDRLKDQQATIDKLVEAYKLAIEDMEHWGSYVDDYFKAKHGFNRDIETMQDLIKSVTEKSDE